MTTKVAKLEDIANIDYGTRVVKSRDQGTIYPVYGGGGETFRMDKYNRENCVVVSRFAMSPLCTRYVSEKIFLNDSGLTVSTKDENVLLQEYLDWCILSRNDEIYSLGRGAAQRNLEIPSFKAMNISYPQDTEKQKRVIRKLRLADEIRQKKKLANAKLDEFLKSTFIDLFGNPVKNNMGWPIDSIQNLANSENAIKAGPFGSTLKKDCYVDEGYKIYGQEQVISNDINYGDYYIDEKKYKSLLAYKINSGDVLISLVGSYGRLLIIPSDFQPGIINPRLMKITFDQNKILPVFFKFLFGNKTFQNLLNINSHGGTMGILNVRIIKKLKIIIPPIELQNKFIKIVKKVEAQKQKNEQIIKQMDNLFNSLSQKAFKGEL